VRAKGNEATAQSDAEVREQIEAELARRERKQARQEEERYRAAEAQARAAEEAHRFSRPTPACTAIGGTTTPFTRVALWCKPRFAGTNPDCSSWLPFDPEGNINRVEVDHQPEGFFSCLPALVARRAAGSALRPW
jgi:hypothetical protein